MEEKKDLRPILLWLVSWHSFSSSPHFRPNSGEENQKRIEEHRPLTIQEDMTLAEGCTEVWREGLDQKLPLLTAHAL